MTHMANKRNGHSLRQGIFARQQLSFYRCFVVQNFGLQRFQVLCRLVVLACHVREICLVFP